MKLFMNIYDIKLENGNKNQPVKIYGFICNIQGVH